MKTETNSSITKPKGSLFPIILTIFIDMLGVGIVIPILAAVFMNPAIALLPASYSAADRGLVLGFVIGLYPLAQFFGAPILGALSDKYGRKPILTISLLGTFLGYVLFALGITTGNIVLVVLSRTLDGFTGGNISIATSSIADITDAKSKAKNFGLIGMAFSFGFIMGPYIGGKLSDPSVLSWFNAATPFWFAAILTLINIISVQFQFSETIKELRTASISFTTGFRNIYKAFTFPNLRVMFTVGFLLTFGFSFFTQFFQVFLIDKFNYSESQIGDLFAYMGLCIAITQGFVTRGLSKRFSSDRILRFSLLFLALTLPVLLVPSQGIWLYAILPFVALFNGITQPNSTAIISNLAEDNSQGEIMGINQSVVSIAQALPPIISGFLMSLNVNLPILFAGGFVFLAWLVFRFSFNAKTEKKFEEI